jgi:hypothetical protein
MFRIPGEEIDELRHFDSTESKHIIVYYRGLYYSVECVDYRNQILSPSSLQYQFEWIINDAQSKLVIGKYLMISRLSRVYKAKNQHVYSVQSFIFGLSDLLFDRRKINFLMNRYVYDLICSTS